MGFHGRYFVRSVDSREDVFVRHALVGYGMVVARLFHHTGLCSMCSDNAVLRGVSLPGHQEMRKL